MSIINVIYNKFPLYKHKEYKKFTNFLVHSYTKLNINQVQNIEEDIVYLTAVQLWLLLLYLSSGSCLSIKVLPIIWMEQWFYLLPLFKLYLNVKMHESKPCE